MQNDRSKSEDEFNIDAERKAMKCFCVLNCSLDS